MDHIVELYWTPTGGGSLAGPGIYISQVMDTPEYGSDLLIVEITDKDGNPALQAKLTSSDLKEMAKKLRNGESDGRKAPIVDEFPRGGKWSVITRAPALDDNVVIKVSRPQRHHAEQYWLSQIKKRTDTELIYAIYQFTRVGKEISPAASAFIFSVLNNYAFDFLMKVPMKNLDNFSIEKLKEMTSVFSSSNGEDRSDMLRSRINNRKLEPDAAAE